MALTTRLEFRQSQALVMTPQLMQAIKLLQLSNLDLAAYVEGELERNPLLERVPGSAFQPHYGFGAGVLRLILGDNVLSGGHWRSSFHRWLMLGDASLSVDGESVVDAGRFAFAAPR